jgi:sugar-specific transcriptional regulator TrmB
MPNFKEIKNELHKFGLSESQALIYLTLIQHGELRIQELSDLTQIPRTSVYEHLKTLLELGLVERIVDEKFIKIKPYPITAIRHGLSEQLIELQTQLSKLDNLDKAIELLPKNGLSPATVVRYYKGVSGARQLLWNTLKAKEFIYVYSAWGRGRYVGMKFYKSFVAESRQRSIKEQVLVNPSRRVFESIRNYAGTSTGRTLPKDIRAVKEADILIKGETFIYGNIFAQLYLREEEINGFEIESLNFTQMQRSIFETLWKMAQPVSALL